MSRAFESIQQGLREAIEFAEGKNSKAIVHEVDQIDGKAVFKKVGMSEAELGVGTVPTAAENVTKTVEQKRSLGFRRLTENRKNHMLFDRVFF